MSSAKFASITASLLARKGEATPWTPQDSMVPPLAVSPLPWRNEFPHAVAAPPPPPLIKERACSVRMSAHDFERLGILAVKANVTRQQLLKDALAQFLAAKAGDYPCTCLGSCDRGCSSTQ
jgi:hypothetical protein